MPGLRSLVARRRCSLPSTHVIASEAVVCSYPSGPASVSSHKRNSLDEINKESEKDHSKWDLKTLFEINEYSGVSSKPDHGCHNELFSCASNKSGQINAAGNTLNISEKENSSLSQSPTAPYEVPLKQEIAQDVFLPSKKEGGHDFEREMALSNNPVSPERIVIKMKLLHGNSLSDVTNIAADNSEGADNIKRSDSFEPGTSSKSKTRWTIDSILNQPVDSPKLENDVFTETKVKVEPPEPQEECAPLHFCSQELSERLPDKIDVNKHSFSPNEVNLNCNHLDFVPSEHNVWPSINNSNLLCNGTNGAGRYEDIKPLTTQLKYVSGCIDPIRRPSNSSDTSEDSVLSEVSTVSSNSCSSSGSSVKSCSIVIKRLENSNSYSCFRSPKNKHRQCRKINLTRTVYLKKEKSSLPLLYIPKRFLYATPSDILPCSVTLCDIFSNYPFTRDFCPRCLSFYNLPSDIYVNTISSTITLQCYTCKWLVVRTLKSKEINIYTKTKYHSVNDTIS